MARTKFDQRMLITMYEVAKSGGSQSEVAKSVGIELHTLNSWISKKPAVKDAIDRGRAIGGSPKAETTFQQYVYGKLPKDVRAVWDAIQKCEDAEDPEERIEAILEKHGKTMRQHLFMYGLIESNFNMNKTLRKLNISFNTYRTWKHRDPGFAELMNNIHWYKDNFFESAFIGRVVAGDTAAIIHAAKTKLRKRGYNEKIEIEHTGTVNHNHMVSILDLGLDLETKKKVLDALREKQRLEEGQPKVIEA